MRKPIQVKLTEAEKAAFEAAAAAKGQSLSEWIRQSCRKESKMNEMHCQCGEIFGEACESDDAATVAVYWVAPMHRDTAKALGITEARGARYKRLTDKIMCCEACAANVLREEKEWAFV